MTLAGHDEANGYALAAVGVGLLIGGIIYTIVGSKVPAWSMTLFAAVSNVVSLILLVQFLFSGIHTGDVLYIRNNIISGRSRDRCSFLAGYPGAYAWKD